MAKKALGVKELLTLRPAVYQFTGKWQRSIGIPAHACSILVWGDSGNGKTGFVLQLAKYYATFTSVVYDSLEEGHSKTIQDAYKLLNMMEVDGKLLMLDKEPIPDLRKRLASQRSPAVVVIDSVQYSDMTYDDYRSLRAAFPRKTFILISHADGKTPYGAVAKSIMYNADIKVHVQGFRAFIRTRFGGGRPYDVWPEEAERQHGQLPE